MQASTSISCMNSFGMVTKEFKKTKTASNTPKASIHLFSNWNPRASEKWECFFVCVAKNGDTFYTCSHWNAGFHTLGIPEFPHYDWVETQSKQDESKVCHQPGISRLVATLEITESRGIRWWTWDHACKVHSIEKNKQINKFKKIKHYNSKKKKKFRHNARACRTSRIH